MSVNPAPTVNIIKAIDATVNNMNNIAFTLPSQTEVITEVLGEIYIGSSRICTYNNTSSPVYTTNGYLFPLYIPQTTPSPAHIVWDTGYSPSDWVNGATYYIRLKLKSESGFSSFSDQQAFTTYLTPTITITPIEDDNGSGTISSTTWTAEATVTTTSGNSVESYRFKVVDMGTGSVVNDSGLIYNTSTSTSDFSYVITNLEQSHRYQVRFNCTTVNKSEVEGHSNIFTVDTGYSMYVDSLTVTNACELGYINIDAECTSTTKPSSSSEDINYIWVQRSLATGSSRNWITLYKQEISPISASNPAEITYKDYYAQSGQPYVYRLVPVVKQGTFIVSGSTTNITESASVTAQCRYVWLVDKGLQYQLYAGIAYESQSTNQQTGVHTPLGSIYPTVIRNANTKYISGGFSGTVVPIDMLNDAEDLISLENRYNIREYREQFEAFLTNGMGKVLKDWNGNIWLIEITDNVSTSYDNNIGMGIASVSGSWTQIGDVMDENNLIDCGLVEGV